MPTSSSARPPSNDAPRAHALGAAPSRQRGVALILVLMLAVTASTFVVLTALNNRSSRATAQRVATVEALGQARRALLGYAVSYADGSHSLEKGPGRLPCPDLADGSVQGVAESVGDCRAASDRETGRLPFRTLGLATLTDGSGAPLWYAVSENFRSMATGIVNSETAGSFSVDDTDDVVAVIIAPGPPLNGQLRNSGSAYTAAAWLESDNASIGDNRFTRDVEADSNDTMMIITRSELMVEVEKVVTKEVDRALSNYRRDPDGDDDPAGADPDCTASVPQCDDGLPWLAPRGASNFVAVVDEGTTALARLPLLELGKTYNAEFTALWSLATSGAVIFSGAEPPAESCLRNTACTQNVNDKPAVGAPTPTPVTFPAAVFGAPSAPWNQGTCMLDRNKDAAYALNFTCTASYSYTVPGRSLRRVYQIDVGGNTRLVAPTLTARRTLEVRAAGTAAWPAGTLARITISDLEGTKIIGAGKLEFTTLGSADLIEVAQIPFDLEVWTELTPLDRQLSPGALPPWLFADKWHESLLLRYAPSDAPGHSGENCQTSATCLTLRMSHPGDAVDTDVAGIRGIVVAPGPPLAAIVAPATPAQTRPSANLADYLEGENKSDASTYQRHEPSSSFNDQVLPLSP